MDISEHLLKGSIINGTTVEDRQGETVGSIKDIVIDTKSGIVLYAVLAVNTGFLNLGSKYFAMPLQALVFDPENRRILIDTTKEKLEKSPGFDKDNWPQRPQKEFIDSIYDYYEVPRAEGFAAEVASNRGSFSGNAASRQGQTGFRSDGSNLHESKSYDHNVSGNYDKSIH